ncbi:MAG: hypothetical protein ABS35_22765 [Kaistia sp. SCN 65-12]|nr:MAG: hypothetical protein ABS35_22765 [Kaistia sp. SCN 65-12]
MARTPRKNSETPAGDPAAASPVIPVESEEQSGAAREAPSAGSERQPAVGATGADVGVQPEGAETSSAIDLSSAADPHASDPLVGSANTTESRVFEALSNILHDGIETPAGGEILLDRASFELLKAAGAVAGDWPED